jgi:Transmembrane domain of unknown function (DUF3566)
VKTIRKFDPISVMKIAAICYALLGLIEGAFFAVVFSFVPLAGPETQNVPKFFGAFFGFGALIVFPILCAVMGAVGGAIGAVVYNLSARFVGGIQVEVD